MEVNNRVESLEKEFKLIKGELKETLASVRDYLTSFKLPSPGDSRLLEALNADDKQNIVMSGGLDYSSNVSLTETPGVVRKSAGRSAPAGGPSSDKATPGEKTTPGGGGGSPVKADGAPAGQITLTDAEIAEIQKGYGGDIDMEAVAEAPGREPERDYERERYEEHLRAEAAESTPKVNMLANLIRWIAHAKKEIGQEPMAAFLEVYGISGHLSAELKDIILQLAGIAQPGTAGADSADIWSRLMLELHGILTGGDAPLHTIRPGWGGAAEEEAAEEEAAGEEDVEAAAEDAGAVKPLKLKLVLDNGDGAAREFSINLDPEA